MKLKDAKQVVEWRLCVGCGACAYICPKNNIKLVDYVNDGIRPELQLENCDECLECIKVCPGYGFPDYHLNGVHSVIPELKGGWGKVLEIWEGYATDQDIRFSGSSGGLASALALYCLEKKNMTGVVHTGSDYKTPWKNRTVFSQNRAEILNRTGSRYSPASPCDALGKIEFAPSQCIFVGKPCDVTGLRKAQSLRPELDKKTGLAIGIFCAGTPASRGTLDLMNQLDVNPDDVDEVRYRGRGWPGMFSMRMTGEDEVSDKMAYMDAWRFIQKYRPYRCYLCPDGTSEYADISCGDPWYREKKEDKLGYSLVLVRTDKGREIIHNAIKDGYIHLEEVSSRVLVDSQESLLAKRKAIWGRLLAMKMFSIPTPEYNGFPLRQNWLSLSTKEKAHSIFGTLRRIITRKYYKPLP